MPELPGRRSQCTSSNFPWRSNSQYLPHRFPVASQACPGLRLLFFVQILSDPGRRRSRDPRPHVGDHARVAGSGIGTRSSGVCSACSRGSTARGSPIWLNGDLNGCRSAVRPPAGRPARPGLRQPHCARRFQHPEGRGSMAPCSAGRRSFPGRWQRLRALQLACIRIVVRNV